MHRTHNSAKASSILATPIDSSLSNPYNKKVNTQSNDTDCKIQDGEVLEEEKEKELKNVDQELIDMYNDFDRWFAGGSSNLVNAPNS